jgi:hypothetical protein
VQHQALPDRHVTVVDLRRKVSPGYADEPFRPEEQFRPGDGYLRPADRRSLPTTRLPTIRE